MAYPSILRFARPRTFLYLMSLRTGTELIMLTLLANKLTGVYGILALLTGYHLSSMQLSMYIYSILALLLTAWLAPHIRKQSPLQCLALAWFYVLDSIINALYTVAFGVGWFLVLLNHHSGEHKAGPGSGMMDDISGFTSPKITNSYGDVVATAIPSPGAGSANAGMDAAFTGNQHAPGSSGTSTSSVSGILGNTILHSGSIASITVISALWAVRVYFILVIMAYARGVLRQHIALSSSASPAPQQSDHNNANTTSAVGAVAGAAPLAQISVNDTGASNTTANTSDAKPMISAPSHSDALFSHQALPSPFAPPATLSFGWTGKLGRLFVAVFPSYWLGAPIESEECADLNLSAMTTGAAARKTDAGGTPGVFERERRRRAGTGPPMLKPIELGKVGT